MEKSMHIFIAALKPKATEPARSIHLQ